MNDPHVNQVRYTLESIEGYYFLDSCQIVNCSYEDYDFQIEKGILVCTFKLHISSEAEAKEFIKPMLRTWEIYYGLNQGNEEFHFKFKDSEIIDRNPPPPPPPGSVNVICGSGSLAATVSMTAKAIVGRSEFPTPPINFVINEDIEMLWQRYSIWRNDKYKDIHLLSTAYFFSTYITQLSHSEI